MSCQISTLSVQYIFGKGQHTEPSRGGVQYKKGAAAEEQAAAPRLPWAAHHVRPAVKKNSHDQLEAYKHNIQDLHAAFEPL